MNKTAKAILLFIALGVFVLNAYGAEKAPEWVVDSKKVYPEKDWICVVESASNKQQAQSNASAALARVFKVDIKAVSSAMESFSQTVQNGASAYSKNASMGQQISTQSEVSGLMGVVHDFWTDSNKTVYASARMNRKDGAGVYTTMIKDNDKVIATLIRHANSNPKTFDAYESWSVAANLAVLTDSYLDILAVLNPQTRASLKSSYANAAIVKRAAQESAHDIVIVVQVEGDQGGRIKKAFQQIFTKRGLTTSDSVDVYAYILKADFNVSEVSMPGTPDKLARYVINAALSDASGTEIVTFSGNKRVGSLSYSEAAQRAIRTAESSIGDIDDDESFAVMFDDYLISLLK